MSSDATGTPSAPSAPASDAGTGIHEASTTRQVGDDVATVAIAGRQLDGMTSGATHTTSMGASDAPEGVGAVQSQRLGSTSVWSTQVQPGASTVVAARESQLGCSVTRVVGITAGSSPGSTWARMRTGPPGTAASEVVSVTREPRRRGGSGGPW